MMKVFGADMITITYRGLLAGCVVLSAADLARGQSLIYRGLPHDARGEARIRVTPDDALLVANIGSSGLDGVSVALGEGEFWTGSFVEFDTGGSPTGAGVTTRMQGIVGSSVATIAEVALTDVGRLLEVSVDYPYLGSPPVDVTVFFEDLAVATATAVTGPLVQLEPSPYRLMPFASTDSEVTSSLELSAPISITIPGQPTVMGTRIVASTPVGLPVVAATQVDITARDVASFTLDDETLGKFGLAHRALGEATLAASGICPSCVLTVGNIGSSGDDGVEIELGAVDGFELLWEPLAPAGGLPDGAGLQLGAVGTVDGIPGSDVGWFRVDDVGRSLAVNVDFSAIGAPSRTVEVYDDGVRVARQAGITASVVATLAESAWVDGWAVRRRVGSTGAPGFSGIWQADVEIAIVGGPTVTGDRLLVIAEHPASTVDDLAAAVDRPIDIPEMGLVKELPLPCPGDLDGDGDVDLSDLAQLLANYGTTSGATAADGDLDGDGDVDLADLAALLAVYGTTCP